MDGHSKVMKTRAGRRCCLMTLLVLLLLGGSLVFMSTFQKVLFLSQRFYTRQRGEQRMAI